MGLLINKSYYCSYPSLPISKVKLLNMTSVSPVSDQSMFCFNSNHSHSSNYALKGLVDNLDLLWLRLALTILTGTPSWRSSANLTIFTYSLVLFVLKKYEYFWRSWIERVSFVLIVRFISWRPFWFLSLALCYIFWVRGLWTEQMINEALLGYWDVLADINNIAHFNKRRYLEITKN